MKPSVCFLLAAALAAPVFSVAQSPGGPALPIAPLVVTATRNPLDPASAGTTVDILTGEDLARRQIFSLSQALGGLAGAPVLSNGASGASSSLFLRGANSNQTAFLVDGIRFSDPNTDYNVFLGGACISACDSLELSHGPQSTLYGGEAVGGVVALRAQRGAGPGSAVLALEGGSFGTWQGAFSGQRASDGSAYNFAVQAGRTENERPNNSFESANTTFRYDRTLNATVSAGATLRWFHGVYGDPGDRHTNDPDNRIREENVLATAFLDAEPAPGWKAHVVLGGQDRRFVAENPRAGAATQVTVVKNRRAVLDAQATYTGIARHRATGGFTAEANHTRNTGFGDINRKQKLLALFFLEEFAPVPNVLLTAGLRSDDFDTFGRATTGRATAAFLNASRSLKFRGSYGTGFRSPSFLDLYGRSAFYVGNPALQPEKVRGWDAGVDAYLAGGRGTVSLTYFENDYRDLIAFDFAVFPGTVVNLERARSRGVEFSARLVPVEGWEVRVAATHLEADNLTAGQRLLRRPRLSFSADVWHAFGSRLQAGAGLSGAAQREDVDARTFARIDAEDYALARAFAAWQLSRNVSLRLRVENLLDESYESVNGYPATGRAAFAAVERRW